MIRGKGFVLVEFKLNTNSLHGKTLVVFETLYDNENHEIANHKNLKDENQSVTVPTPPTEPPTGDTKNTVIYLLILMCVFVILNGAIYAKK